MKLKNFLPQRALLIVTFLLAITCVLIAQVASATPKSHTQLPILSETEPIAQDSPCYFQTQDGSMVDLSRLCGAASTPSQSATIAPSQLPSTSAHQSYPQPPSVYNYRKMKAFDDSVYGSRNSVYGNE